LKAKSEIVGCLSVFIKSKLLELRSKSFSDEKEFDRYSMQRFRKYWKELFSISQYLIHLNKMHCKIVLEAAHSILLWSNKIVDGNN